MTPTQYHGLLFALFLTGALISPHKHSARTPMLFCLAVVQWVLMLMNTISK